MSGLDDRIDRRVRMRPVTALALHDDVDAINIGQQVTRFKTNLACRHARFDVQRQPNEHVAFGFGSHFCLGQALARLELRVMFEQLLIRMPDIELAVEPADLPRRPANFIICLG